MDRNYDHVRAADGRVPGQARKSLWIETTSLRRFTQVAFGQARKSLWIETGIFCLQKLSLKGQARKSLWIETGNWIEED